MDLRAPLDHVWLRAALLGSVWASIEIVLGSFLHNIRFPITGTILAAIGTALLVAGSTFWKETGLLWRTGLICALMKSISPSALIFGPMIGILLEAVLLEGAVRVFGRTLPAYLLGGALATLMPILQQIVGILFTYGFDVARLYIALYEFAAKSLHFHSFGPLDLLLLLLGMNIVLGAVAGALGRIVGRLALEQPPLAASATSPSNPYQIDAADPTQGFSLSLLGLHAAAMLGGFLAIGNLPLWASAGLIILYLTFCFRYYPRVRTRFRKPRLWIEFGLVSLLAGLLLGELTSKDSGWSWTGLRTGLEMSLRASLVVVAFTAISVELRNPRILGWFLRRGLGQLASALGVAFEALPVITGALGDGKSFLRHPLQSAARVLSSGIAWLDDFERKNAPSPSLFILTGKQGSGKTTFLTSLVKLLRHDGISVGGILAPVVRENGERKGYDVSNILTGQRVPLCRADARTTGIAAGPYHFLPEGIALGSAALAADTLASCDVVCIDEIGPLEINGNGWAGPLERLRRDFKGPIILLVRPELVHEVLQRWNFQHYRIWAVGEDDPADAKEDLLQHLRHVPDRKDHPQDNINGLSGTKN